MVARMRPVFSRCGPEARSSQMCVECAQCGWPTVRMSSRPTVKGGCRFYMLKYKRADPVDHATTE